MAIWKILILLLSPRKPSLTERFKKIFTADQHLHLLLTRLRKSIASSSGSRDAARFIQAA